MSDLSTAEQVEDTADRLAAIDAKLDLILAALARNETFNSNLAVRSVRWQR